MPISKNVSASDISRSVFFSLSVTDMHAFIVLALHFHRVAIPDVPVISSYSLLCGYG